LQLSKIKIGMAKAEKIVSVLTWAEFARKYNIPDYCLSKKKYLFETDPGHDKPKPFDNEYNIKLANQIMSEAQKRPNAKGKKKPVKS
jgi:hypothetical protein